MVSAPSEGCRKIGVVEVHRVMLGAGRHNFPAVVVGLGHIADLKEGHYIAVMGTGLGAMVVAHKGAVREDIRADEDLG